MELSKYRKTLKLPLRTLRTLKPKNSQIPKRYKRNKIASNFDTEVSIITKKYLDAGYSVSFIKSVVRDFKKMDENQPILTDWLFEEHRKILFKLSIALQMSTKLKDLLRKLKALLKVK